MSNKFTTKCPCGCGRDVHSCVFHCHVILDRLPKSIADNFGGSVELACHCGARHSFPFRSWRDSLPPWRCKTCNMYVPVVIFAESIASARDQVIEALNKRAAMS